VERGSSAGRQTHRNRDAQENILAAMTYLAEEQILLPTFTAVGLNSGRGRAAVKGARGLRLVSCSPQAAHQRAKGVVLNLLLGTPTYYHAETRNLHCVVSNEIEQLAV
jgi:hypothetical protein